MIIDLNIKFTGGCLLDEQNVVLTLFDEDVDEYYSNYSVFSFWNIAEPTQPTFTTKEVRHWASEMIRYKSTKDGFDGICCLSPDGKLFFIQNNKIVQTETIKDSDRWGGLRNLCQIGETLYVCGNKGQIYQRIKKNSWQHIDDSILSAQDLQTEVNNRQKVRDEVINSLPEEERTVINIMKILKEKRKQEKKIEEINLSSINGRDSQDMYACGNSTTSQKSGVAFHYNGKGWQRLSLPETDGLFSVLCSDKNSVYLAGYNGYLLKGNAQQGFVEIDQAADLASVYQLIQVAGRIYLSTSKGLRQLVNDRIEEADISAALREVAPELLDYDVSIDGYGDSLLIVGEKAVCRYSFAENKVDFVVQINATDED